MIVLPLAENDKMLDALDVADADNAKNADEMVPSEVVNALIKGENPVRVWRNHRNMAARTLAQNAGLSAAYISEIETGKKDGSVSAMKKIAAVLDVDLDDIV